MAESALGKGLDALIKKPEKKSKKSTTKTNKSNNKKEVKNQSNSFSLSQEKIDEIKDDVSSNPRISLWSIKSAAALKYLKKTIPEFSISNEASVLLEDAISNKYPEIWELFDDME